MAGPSCGVLLSCTEQEFEILLPELERELPQVLGALSSSQDRNTFWVKTTRPIGGSVDEPESGWPFGFRGRSGLRGQ
jgi:hypothetical protein